jgi:hypothetical protein
MKTVYAVVILALFIWGCLKLDEPEEYNIVLPYPTNNDILYYQAESDSGYQEWWTDIKAVTSAFLNNSQYWDSNTRPEDIIIIGEGIFHGLIEVELPDMILELTMERKFKSRGRKSVWQVIVVKEKPWPKQSLK